MQTDQPEGFGGFFTHCLHITSNEDFTASFHVPSNSVFTNNSTIRLCVVKGTGSMTNSKMIIMWAV